MINKSNNDINNNIFLYILLCLINEKNQLIVMIL